MPPLNNKPSTQHTMKKVVFILTWVVLSVANLAAQNYKIEDAILSWRNGDHERAKQDIDIAAANTSTANDPKMWKVKGWVYLAIGTDTNYSKLDADALYVSLNSFINCILIEKNEKKKKNTPEALSSIVDATRNSIIKSYYYYDNNNYQKCIEYWELILKAYEVDTTGEAQKIVPKNELIQNCATVAMRMGDKKKAQGFYLKMIEDPKYLSPTAYLQMSVMLMEEGDTAKALEIIQKGRVKIPDDKSLFNQEISIYTQQGKLDLLMVRLNEVIQSEPNNTLYLFYRGAIVNDHAVKIMDGAPQWSDSAVEVRKLLKKAKTDPEKKKHQAKMDKYIARRDSIYEAAKPFFDAAEKDYNEALLIDPNYFDALFNMGVLHFNKNKELIDKYNYLDNTNDTKAAAAELDNRRKAGYEKAKEYLDKAFEIKQDDESLLLALQQTYSQLGYKFVSSIYKFIRENGKMPCQLFDAKTMEDVVTQCGEPASKTNETKENKTIVVYMYDTYKITFVNNLPESILSIN